MKGFNAGLPTVPTSADGVLKPRPGSIAFGSGRVMVLEVANLTIALSETL